MQNHRTLLLLALSFPLAACVENRSGDDGGSSGSGGSNSGSPKSSLNGVDLDADGDGDGIVDLPPSVNSIIRNVFQRYTALIAPNGKRVHVLVQGGVSDARVVRARSILAQQLTDVPGSTYGANKDDVFDAMGVNEATLAIFRDAASYDPNDVNVDAFLTLCGDRVAPLFGDEIIIEGSPEYIAPSPAYDGTFQATAALVFRQGLIGTRPGYVDAIRMRTADDITSGLYVPPTSRSWLLEDAESFLGVTLETFYGIWGHDPDGDGTAAHGAYAFHTREEMEAGDLPTVGTLRKFFVENHVYEALIDPGFQTTFECRYEPGVRPYSNRSRYLTRMTLQGPLRAHISADWQENVLVGNDEQNRLKGRSGDDFLDGGPDDDAAVFDGHQGEYIITDLGGGSFRIEDTVPNRDDTDTLVNIEFAIFDGLKIRL